jgi:hypothetical protein
VAAAESITGTQTRGSAGQSATLTCSPVTINSPRVVSSISGSNEGFWIVQGSATVARFYKQNDPAARGLTLQPGTYYVYPNLKSGQQKATVTVVIR